MDSTVEKLPLATNCYTRPRDSVDLEKYIPVLLSLSNLSYETRSRITDSWKRGDLLQMDWEIFVAAARQRLQPGKTE
jgi:hypothetical protein